jgi:uncharacterized membrane protein YkvA (DUF1232 family)
VYFAARDPRTPLLIRGLAVLVAAYALSPIDLIPDFIPVLGAIDELVLIPLGLALIIRLLPAEVLKTARLQAARASARLVSYAAATFFLAFWLVVSMAALRWWSGAR